MAACRWQTPASGGCCVCADGRVLFKLIKHTVEMYTTLEVNPLNLTSETHFRGQMRKGTARFGVPFKFGVK